MTRVCGESGGDGWLEWWRWVRSIMTRVRSTMTRARSSIHSVRSIMSSIYVYMQCLYQMHVYAVYAMC
jgi:hypothetical protein